MSCEKEKPRVAHSRIGQRRFVRRKGPGELCGAFVPNATPMNRPKAGSAAWPFQFAPVPMRHLRLWLVTGNRRPAHSSFADMDWEIRGLGDSWIRRFGDSEIRNTPPGFPAREFPPRLDSERRVRSPRFSVPGADSAAHSSFVHSSFQLLPHHAAFSSFCPPHFRRPPRGAGRVPAQVGPRHSVPPRRWIRPFAIRSFVIPTPPPPSIPGSRPTIRAATGLQVGGRGS